MYLIGGMQYLLYYCTSEPPNIEEDLRSKEVQLQDTLYKHRYVLQMERPTVLDLDL